MIYRLLNILMSFGRHNIKIAHFDPYNVILSIATNIPVLPVSVFVLQGHRCVLFLGLMSICLMHVGHCTEAARNVFSRG